MTQSNAPVPQVPPVPAAPPSHAVEIEFFNALTDRVPAEGAREADALVKFLGRFRLLAAGTEKFSEASHKQGMVDQAQKARVGFIRSDQRLILIPAAASDESAVTVSWSSKRSGASLRLRSAFLHYGIEMLKNSVWSLQSTVQELPGVGACLVFDLKTVISEIEEAKTKSSANN